MTCVLVLQCFLFQDGLTALGANVLNMALVATGVASVVLSVLRRVLGDGLRARLLATAFAAWCSTVAASVCCAGELAASGTVAWHAALPAMAGVHMIIGLGEALVTTLVVASVSRLRPELVEPGPAPSAGRAPGALVGQGLMVAVGLAVSSPRSRAAGRTARAWQRAWGSSMRQPLLAAPWPDYAVPGSARRRWRPCWQASSARVSRSRSRGSRAAARASTSPATRRSAVVLPTCRAAHPLRGRPRAGLAARGRRGDRHRVPAAGAWARTVGAGLVATTLLLRVPLRTVLRRLLLVEPFVLGVAVLSLLQPHGGVVFASMLCKSTACLLVMILLAETTRFSELLGVARRLRLPAVLVTTLGLTHRYPFVLREESSRLPARRSRTFAAGRRGAWSAAAGVIAQLFVRTHRAGRAHLRRDARPGRS
jgi:hypothetical protein